MRSVSDFILYVFGVPVFLQSKVQKSVTLSSSDAEWVAYSMHVKEAMFMIQLLDSQS